MTINPRMQLFFNTLVEKGIVSRNHIPEIETIWKTIQIGRPCPALITSVKRNGQVCGRACVKDENNCMCHLPKEKRTQMKTDALVNPYKIAKKAQNKEKKEALKAQKKAQKAAEKETLKVQKAARKEVEKIKKKALKVHKEVEKVKQKVQKEAEKEDKSVKQKTDVLPKKVSKKAKIIAVEYE